MRLATATISSVIDPRGQALIFSGLDGYRIAPHWHPKRENVTVISGTFKVGMGDRFDESKMGDFPAGSFAYLDPEYASLRDGERRGGGPNPWRISVSDQLRQS